MRGERPEREGRPMHDAGASWQLQHPSISLEELCLIGICLVFSARLLPQYDGELTRPAAEYWYANYYAMRVSLFKHAVVSQIRARNDSQEQTSHLPAVSL